MNKTSIGLLVVALTLISSVLYYFLREVPDPPLTPAVSTEKAVTNGDIQFLGSGLSQTKDGKMQWQVNADQIQVGADKKMINLTNIRAEMYDNGEQGNIQLTANQGQMDTTNKVMDLRGNITAVSDKGTEFVSSLAKWMANERRFIAEGNVQFRQKDITIMGEKLEADQNFTLIRVSGNAQAELRRVRQ
jgi:LPS export ABC transporter protein LptC